MPLLKNFAFVADDWTLLDDEQPVTPGAAVIVSLTRLKANWDALANHAGLLGVSVQNTDEIDAILPYVSRLSLVSVPFPAFTDGRSYSLVRQLRQQGFTGEIRATGAILPDQVALMLQVGVDSFVVTERFSLESWKKAASHISYSYQRGLRNAAAEQEVWSARHHGFEAWTEQPHAG